MSGPGRDSAAAAESDAGPFSELRPLAPLAPRAAVATVSGPWTARLWSGAVNYMPVLVMGLLAALTWWLVRNSPMPTDDTAAAPPRHIPDYEMRGFSLVSYTPSGKIRSRIEGDRMRHFPDNDTVEIDDVRVRLIDEEGRTTVATARTALSNGDGTQVRLMGSAHVVREGPPNGANDDRVDFRGEFIELHTDTERVFSHLPVVVTTSTGEIRASSLDYSHLNRNGVLGGRVTGQFVPAPVPAGSAASAPPVRKSSP